MLLPKRQPAFLVFIMLKLIPIKTVYPRSGTQPHKPLPVFQDTSDLIGRQTVLYSQTVEKNIFRRKSGSQYSPRQDHYDTE